MTVLFTLNDDRIESNIFNITDKLAVIKTYTLDGEEEACFDVVALPNIITTYTYDKIPQNGCCEVFIPKEVNAPSNSLETIFKTNDCVNTWAVSTSTGTAVISMNGYYKLRLRDPNKRGNYHVTIDFIDPHDIQAAAYNQYDVSKVNCHCSLPVADPTLPILGGGFIYRTTDIRDPLATTAITTCSGEVWGYAYPTSTPLSPIPIKACTTTGEVILGYAKATSSVNGLITPDFCS